MRTLALVTIAALLSGCGGAWSNPVPLNLNLTGSDYCTIAKPVTWNPKDTKATIGQVRRENAKHARVCPKAKPAKTATKGWLTW
jgi:hypothetical protein